MIKRYLVKKVVEITKKEIDKHDDAKKIVCQMNNSVDKTVKKIETEAEKSGGAIGFITCKTINIAKNEVNKYT